MRYRQTQRLGSLSTRLHLCTALFVAALYVVASARWLLPGVCVGMCAPLPSGGEAASYNTVRPCCASSMPFSGGMPDPAGEGSPDVPGCALCTLLTAPGTPSAQVNPAPGAPELSGPRPVLAQAVHSARVHAPGMPRDPPHLPVAL